VFRVVCLGESSTFGYHNADTETYPFLLQELLTRAQLPVQVINAGFPYYNSGSIVSLFNAEILAYQPDLITLYAGYNDTSWPLHVGWLGRVALWTQSHSITYLVMRNTVSRFAFRVEQRALERLIPQKMRADEFSRDMELVAGRYRQNVLSIIGAARSRGIDVVLIKQPVTAHGPDYERITYDAENQAVRRKFERGEPLSYIEVWMLKQRRLMDELQKIAGEENLPLVDNVKIVDQDRRRLASWVHLTGEGNARLAEVLASVITPYVVQKHAVGSPEAGSRSAPAIESRVR
jgi:lysophospholipase L1-like esterase